MKRRQEITVKCQEVKLIFFNKTGQSYVRSRSLTPQHSQNTVYRSTTPIRRETVHSRIEPCEAKGNLDSTRRRSYLTKDSEANKNTYYRERRETSTNKVTIDGKSYLKSPIRGSYSNVNSNFNQNKSKWDQKRDVKREGSIVFLTILTQF